MPKWGTEGLGGLWIFSEKRCKAVRLKLILIRPKKEAPCFQDASPVIGRH